MIRAWAAVALVAVALAACSSPRRTQGSTGPVATSLVTAQGAYVTLAMGDPTDPLGTFWQLLVRPPGGSRWINQVESTGVATNGGIVLAADEAGTGTSVLAAARPSNLLEYTPIIATSTAGRSWHPDGLVPVSIAPNPYSMAVAALGTLAIGGSGDDVLRRAAGSSNWATQVTLNQLDRSESACEPSAITAVAFYNGQAVVGAACRKDNSSGIFVETGPAWEESGPLVTRGEQSTVLGLRATASGLAALVEVSSRRGTVLLAADRSAGRWTDEPSANLDGQLLSYGPAPGDGWFAITRTSAGDLQLVTSAPHAGNRGWQHLPTPPAGTATVAFGAGPGSVDAFTVDSSGTVLTVWNLPAGSSHWAATQTLKVPIQSSSST